MPDSSPFHESQKLVRCQVVNRYRESSLRFVEIGAFKLWEYLMTNKHGLKVGNPGLCLWIDDAEYEANANVFDRAGTVEEVDRIVVELFDPEHGFAHTNTRYVRRNETEQVLTILRSHIPPPLRDSNACTIDVIHGRVVQQFNPNASRNILMGLEG